jgi:enoyl-CoA hydratase/carnithine racemase
MAMQYLQVSEADGVVVCTLSNPPRHTLVAAALAELQALLDTLVSRSDVRVLVFTGAADDVFIAHYEVGELAESSERQQGVAPAGSGSQLEELHAFHRFLLALQQAPFVTVAAINGHAAGGGFEFALGCDLRLQKAGDYRLGLPETNVGIIPGAGGTQRYARLLGTAKALELILHGELLGPDEALGLGLVHRVLAADGYRDAVLDFAGTLAARAPVALAAAKRAIYQGSELPLEQGLRVEQQQFARCMASRDAAVAMRSWLQGKSWQWEGR